jgi:putative endonuclease
MAGGAYLYVVKCSDESLYVGTTRTSLDVRIAQHNAGVFAGHTRSRRPVQLIFSDWFDQITDAIAAERKLKGRSRAKKLAFIRGDFAKLQTLAKRRS